MAKHSDAQWLVELLHEAQGRIEEDRLAAILENRGRTCISDNYIKKAKAAAKDAKDTNEFLDNLEKSVRMLKREDDKVYMVYPKCYCHHLKEYEGEVPEIYCSCSAGWVKEMFEQALERPVDVKIEASIIRGDNACRIQVLL